MTNIQKTYESDGISATVEYTYEAIPVSDVVYDQHVIGSIFEGGVVVDGLSDYDEDYEIDTGILIIRKGFEI